MRILVLNHEFPPVGGGGGRAAESICTELVKRGHEIKVLTSHLSGLPKQELRDGYQIIRIASLRTQSFRASFLSMGAYILAGLWAGLGLVRVFQPDVIHVHFAVPAGALAWMLSHLTRTPYVLTAHLGDVPGGVPEKTGGWFRWVFPFTRLIWRDAGRIAAVSQVTRELALKYYECEILVIPNGADMKALAPKEVQVHQPPVIVFAGRFMPQKAPLQIARALNQLKDLPWKCVMIGDGPLLADTKMEVASFGMEDRFMFPGWVTPEETMMWFDQSDILFMPSLSEGLPVVGVQAVAKGLAIVASRVGGFADLVDENKNGYLFDPNDLAGFSSALRKLCLDSTSLLSFRRKSLEKANDFEIGRIAESYEEIFHSISGRSNL